MQRKLWTGNPLEYKPLKESQVTESYTLPKISQKDFNEYLSRVREAYLSYAENHKERILNKPTKLRAQTPEDIMSDPSLQSIPKEYFNETFRLP